MSGALPELPPMSLYVARITRRDDEGEPCDCYVVAGPYRNDPGGNAEALDAAAVLTRRNPGESFHVMGFMKGLELRT